MFATISGDMQWCHDLQGRSRVSSSASANTSRKSSNTSRRCRPAERRSICERVVRIWGVWGPDPPCTLKSHPDLGIWVSQEAQFWTRFRHLKMLADVVCMWGPLGSILGTSGSILTSCCMLGPRWRELGDVLLHVGPTVAPCWPIFAKSDSSSPHLGRPRSQYPLCDPFCLCHRCFGYLKPSYLLITKIKKLSSDPPTPS